MKKTPSLDYNEEFTRQLLTEEELDKIKAKAFINLMSELLLKYETEIEKAFFPN